MSTTATSGWMRSTSAEQLVSVAGQPDDLEPGLLEQPGEALAQDHRIVGERYPHGTSARSEVPRPGGLDTVIVPPSASIRSASPRSPEPPVGLAPPIPSSATSTSSRAAGAGELSPGPRWRASAWRRWSVPRWRRSRRRTRAARAGVPSMSERRRVGSAARPHSSSSAAASPRSDSSAGWIPWVSSRSSCRATASASRVSRTIGAAAPSAGSRGSSRPSDIAIDTSRCCVPSCRSRSIRRRSASVACDQPRPRGLKLDQPGAQLGLESLVLERQPGRRADRLHQLGVVLERGIVDQRRDRLAVALDRGRRPARVRLRGARPDGRRRRRSGAPPGSQKASCSEGRRARAPAPRADRPARWSRRATRPALRRRRGPAVAAGTRPAPRSGPAPTCRRTRSPAASAAGPRAGRRRPSRPAPAASRSRPAAPAPPPAAGARWPAPSAGSTGRS